MPFEVEMCKEKKNAQYLSAIISGKMEMDPAYNADDDSSLALTKEINKRIANLFLSLFPLYKSPNIKMQKRTNFLFV
jgi:hypothetical protein